MKLENDVRHYILPDYLPLYTLLIDDRPRLVSEVKEEGVVVVEEEEAGVWWKRWLEEVTGEAEDK